jgi:nicotinate-nucleotide--dimethylbenzimidazole phosphoribosyltransferase
MSPSVDLDAINDAVGLPDESTREEALERQRQLTKPTGSLGRLEDLSVWLSGVQGTCPPRPLDRVSVVVFAADHGVAQSGVSAYPPEVTAQMVRNFLAGGAAVNVLARLAGATVRVLDIAVDVDWDISEGGPVPEPVTAFKVRRGSEDLAHGPAMSREEAEEAFVAGMTVADEEVDGGADLLIPGDMGIGNTTPAATITAILTATDIASVVGRGTGIDDQAWMRKAVAIRDSARRGRPLIADLIALLAECGGADLAATAGFIVQGAVRRTPVLLDGVVSAAAALVAQRISMRTTRWYLASHRSSEPAQKFALDRLQLEPLIDLGLRLGEGSGALIALPLLRAAQATLAEMATFAEAGVADRTGTVTDEDDAGRIADVT